MQLRVFENDSCVRWELYVRHSWYVHCVRCVLHVLYVRYQQVRVYVDRESWIVDPNNFENFLEN